MIWQKTQLMMKSLYVLFRIVAGFEEAMYRFRESAVEASQGRERHFDEAVLTRSFHQLSDSFGVIDIHDYV